MKNKEDNSILIVALVVLLFLFFGGFGMMNVGMYGMHMTYGNSQLCSTVGGIWCYLSILNLFFMLLMLTLFTVLVIWIVRKLQNGGVR
jgi:hypothetical protein